MKKFAQNSPLCECRDLATNQPASRRLALIRGTGLGDHRFNVVHWNAVFRGRISKWIQLGKWGQPIHRITW
jgi:hypothetical protein